MKCSHALLLCLLALFVTSCGDDKANVLKQHVQSDYTITLNEKKLSSGSKAQYIQLEKTINQTYVSDLDSLLNTAFDRQLEKFEDEELGVWAGYMNMFSWLFKSKQSWDDEMNVLSNKYFNALDINQEQHALFEKYLNDLGNLRRQFLVKNGFPSFTQIDLPEETISLGLLSDHTRNNVVIELGSELFEWFLAFIITQIVLLFVDKIVGPWGCIIDISVAIILMIVSIVMSNSNDSKLVDSLKEQHSQSVQIDNSNLIKSLNNNTIHFYESL